MSDMKTGVREIRRKAASVPSMRELYPEIVALFQSHPDELGDFTGTYRFQLTDQNISYGGRLNAGIYSCLEESEIADVTVSATDADFLNLLAGKLSLPKAMLLRKIRVKGNINILTGFAQFLN